MANTCLKSGAFLFCFLLTQLLFPVSLFSQEPPCDPELRPPMGDPYGYLPRDGRCEGIYVKEVGITAPLIVASWTQFFGDYDLESKRPLILDWAVPSNTSVRIRAHGLRRRLHYRMDSLQPGDSTEYTWPLDILSQLNIPRKDLGIIAWMQYKQGAVPKNVLVPLRIRQQDGTIRSDGYECVLLPGVELMEVYTSLAAVGEDGRPKRFLWEERSLKYGYYPAERKIEIPISDLEEGGIYYLEIGVDLRYGGSATDQIWFYHATR